MTQSRLDLERQVLERHLPSNAFRYVDLNTDTPYILMAVKARRENSYTLRVDLNGIPEKWPDMYVTKILCDCKGEELKKGSSCMDVLPSKYGYTHIDYLKHEGFVELERDKDTVIRIDSDSFPYTWHEIYLNRLFESGFYVEEVPQNGWNVSLVDFYYMGRAWLEEYDYYIEHGITMKLDMIFD